MIILKQMGLSNSDVIEDNQTVQTIRGVFQVGSQEDQSNEDELASQEGAEDT